MATAREEENRPHQRLRRRRAASSPMSVITAYPARIRHDDGAAMVANGETRRQ
jgi:hypothetical protein